LCKVPHISTGDILRVQRFLKEQNWVKRLKFYMNAGELVPDDLILNLIHERLLSAKDTLHRVGYLDGFP
jgi:adenylate kinase